MNQVDFEKIVIYKPELPLTESYSVAYESYDRAANILVELRDRNGLSGWGCAAPDEHVTGEGIDDTLASLRDDIIPLLIESGDSPFVKLLEDIAESAPDTPAARAAAEIALYDLSCRQSGIPLSAVTGLYTRSIPTSVTIGICDTIETLRQAAKFIERGFSILKIKGGNDAEHDIERIKALGKEFGGRVALRLDANQGYSLPEATRLIGELEGELEFLEQPVRADDIHSLGRLARQDMLPVMADESVLNARDAMQSASLGVKLINIKLMKCGGIRESLRICDVAWIMGASVMIGCMDELPASMSAAAHVAMAHPAVKFADLDGHLEIDQNFSSGGIAIENGIVSLTGGPGLDVDVKPARISDSKVGEFVVAG